MVQKTEEKKEQNAVHLLPWVTAVAMFIQSLDGTILNTSLPSIARDMGYTATEMHSVIVTYTLTLAMFIPLSGWLADKFGTRTMFMIAVFLFVTGSVFCALSVDLRSFNMARVLQAIGASMMVPIARLAILYQYPKNELLKTMNFITVFGLLGMVVGPSLGGFLSDNLSWHWIFLVNVPIGIIGISMAYRIMPNFKHAVGRFDFRGLVYFSLALIFITMVLELIGSGRTHMMLILGLLFLSGLLALFYFIHYKKTEKPIIDLRLLNIRTLKIGLTGSLVTRLGIGGLPLLLPLMLQTSFGYSASVSGLLLLPSALANVAVKPFMVRIIKFFGYRTVLISNTILLGIILIILGFVERDTPIAYYIILMIFYGAFTSIQMSAMNTITLADLDQDTASGGNTMLVIMQQLSVSFGVSVASLVLSLFQSGIFEIDKTKAFQYTFIILAIFTILSSITFSRLNKSDGGGYM
ncbi:DHA2 family efflux MFS transporter permease subunit [Flavobacterium sp. ANB]|uniref:DHA2 family efflux MFS transporter permease subunit n=1 Tax=unclassified Flavobacterium TaxID=196869 RepID=UPI0012B85842|nr:MULTISPECIES: DHA2 family efflux MFS transporter permease subunit [unclassified Flavobacterium]MBF4516878.1 DHA2 family efflux MFS transporter permease subunit [Flavobacterium sp. ANB]MTD69226.1 DHA2 family efflux MFS transporter permease subunit [Flavobacterium sp. LC2016-13]